MYDDFYSALEQGRIEPITLWKDKVSKWTWMEQKQLEIKLIGIYVKEEREGRYGSNLHRYAMNLAKYISQQSNIQRQMEQEQQTPSTDVNEKQIQPNDADEIKQREIPVELQREDAQRILGWLVEGGFLMASYLPTDKLKPKRKLAYLCYKMSKTLDLGKNNRGNNRKDICWQPFEKLFNTCLL